MRVRIGDGEIGYDSVGAGEGTLVLLHAFPLNREQWARLAPAIAQRCGIRVVSLDARGAGESSPATEMTTVERMAEDTLRALDALGIESFALGGLSMGGYVAFQVVRRAAQQVRGLILADTRATADTEEGRQARETTALYAEEHGVAALFDRDAPKLFAHVTIVNRKEVVEEARRVAERNTPAGMAALARGLGKRPDVTELLPTISAPTLVIAGELDALTPVTDARMMFERIPDARLDVIADAGHLSNLERPEIFAEHVERFLRERVYA